MAGDELRQYITSHERDFLLLRLQELPNDQQMAATLIQDVMDSVSLIPDAIVRHLYVAEISRLVGIPPHQLLEPNQQPLEQSATDTINALQAECAELRVQAAKVPLLQQEVGELQQQMAATEKALLRTSDDER